MELIDRHAKHIMEDCKKRAKDVGLNFSDETLEFIVSNRDMIELSPKIMIPTLYDYWMHDVEVIKGQEKYNVYPHNPFETVINTRPPVSFYNDNNPDWLNIMIFYHVLGHIDFFQNNVYYEHTWTDDFMGKALSDKRRINAIRDELGGEKRFVDYVIEFTRGIDNLANFYEELRGNEPERKPTKVEYFFGEFLRSKELTGFQFNNYIERYNEYIDEYGERDGENKFFEEITREYTEFNSVYDRMLNREEKRSRDLIEFLIEKSKVINKSGNEWMKEVMKIVRDTSIYFQPQIRTNTLNEGFASFIHQYLFERDERISSNEVNYAFVDSRVTAIPSVGYNPYGIGLNLLKYIYDLGEKGKINNFEYQNILNSEKRQEYDLGTGKGWEVVLNTRKNFDDFGLFNYLEKKDFQDFVDKNKLFVSGKKLNEEKRVWEYYIKSRDGEDYRNMVLGRLYHPPNIEYSVNEANELYLNHIYEGKALVTEYIENVLVGLEYLWGYPVKLETTEFKIEDKNEFYMWLFGMEEDLKYVKQRVLYIASNKQLRREILYEYDS